MELEMIRTLFAYNDWANRQLLGMAALVSAMDYKKEMGPAWGSIHGTLAHIWAADQVWFSRIQGHSPLAIPGTADLSSLGLLRSRMESLMEERRVYLHKLGAEDLSRAVHYRDTKGNPYAQTLWQILVHVVNHGTDHRSHIAIMMTEMGYQAPVLDFIVYLRNL